MRRSTLTPALLVLSILFLVGSRPVGAASTLPADSQGEEFSGHTLRFGLPEGYHTLEAIDGGCFVYHESTPGFLVLYRTSAPPDETLADLLAATTNVRHTETPLQVDVGERAFTGLFVETAAGDRLFLAAAEGWGLVAQGSAADWPSQATGLNQVLRTLTFAED